MSTPQAAFAVFLMALVTYIPRALPVAVFRKEITSKYIKSFLYYVPFAVLASLTFPDVFYSTGDIMTAVAGTVVALLLAYCNQSLVIVAAGAIITVFVTGFLF
ncbi:MAG: AzlD domain-containing protein [Clostridiales bacterium]|nr:AzlD domain-containing protein [Clostridiales bacterium]